ncbi:MAG: alpha-amylase, partial [Chloroflexota bacterium]
LGMHRVYNSAFMHMLRDEDNAKYRQVMKNTLEFDPQVLKRYVNFMNNPDEKTAAEQFGATDKYFGVCTLLVTLPGLPMFGHGQIEGYREKCGMEYRRAYWDESVDEGLVRGHEWRIFPLTHRRHLFADVENFMLYDFFTPEGAVNEDVFAYSNRFNDDPSTGSRQAGLVIYHNKYAETRGWVKTSAAFMDKSAGKLVQKTLGEGLGLPAGLSDYVTFRDYATNLEYIRSCKELVEKGLYVDLKGYQCHVFLDWRIVSGEQPALSEANGWKAVCEALNGAGVPSMQAKFDELFAPRVEVKEAQPKKVTKKRFADRVGAAQKKERSKRVKTATRKRKMKVL